jgi:hypothetical protein
MIKPSVCLLLLAGCCAAQVAPRSGWTLVPGAEDLIRMGNWGCVSGVNAGVHSLTVSANASGFNTVINTTGPVLQVTGDFSVMVSIAAPVSMGGVMLTLVGSLNTGEWWNGLKRLDVGIAGGKITANNWTGGSPNPAATASFAAALGPDPVTLEVAHVGSQNIVYVNGAEVGRLLIPACSLRVGFISVSTWRLQTR